MTSFNIIAETTENTVVSEYKSIKTHSSNYQTETELEKKFIRMLCEQGYEYLPIHTQDELISNLRTKLEELNRYTFTDTEWEQFLSTVVANENEGIVEKTRKIQEDNIQLLTRDDGTCKNIMLIDRKNIYNNSLQVINQYVMDKKEGTKSDNRYDVTILVNGLPLVHIELKRRGMPIREAFYQIERYQRDSFWAGSGLYNYIQIFVISNGTSTKYYSNSTRFNVIKDTKFFREKKGKSSNSFEFTTFWADTKNNIIKDLVDFTRTFFAKHTILNILIKYCVFTSENMLLVMRPYQITATERIINKIKTANNYGHYGTIKGGGYIWHTTGSGKTLTSFKAAREAAKLPFIDKVLFVVDRKDLDYQTMKEYDRFEKGAANSNTSTAILKKQLESPKARIIITTIQKFSNFIKLNSSHDVYNKHVVMIFDECHRSQFGKMHIGITKMFKKCYLFGFTGTPIFAVNANENNGNRAYTTEQTFGKKLHSYTIVNAINDKNVLPFRIDYIKTMDKEEEIEDEMVFDINREKALMAPLRIKLVTEYILNHFNQKTYRNERTYLDIQDIACNGYDADKLRQRRKVNGFNSIFAVASIDMAKAYYCEFKKQMAANPQKRINVAIIFSYGANEEVIDGFFDEENSEDTNALDKSSRDFLKDAIKDYNEMFNTSYDTSSERFQNYYKDVSLRMKNREIDLLIVVNMFLTGFDAATLNTLWVDKNLKYHGLLQAFSRTNRILNSVKTFGNIVCFRMLQKRVDEAISLFGDKDACGIVIIKSFNDYYYGYKTEKGEDVIGYVELIEQLKDKYPLSEPQIIGEYNQRIFIALFGKILRMHNLLLSFDEFKGKEILNEREFQDYTGRYNDLYDEWKVIEKGQLVDITKDVVFEMGLVAQIDINVDYILMLVKKYHDENKKDEQILTSIEKAIDASIQLRSKKNLIEAFINKINDGKDIIEKWNKYVAEESIRELKNIIQEENLKPKETIRFVKNSFNDGEIKSIGTDIDNILPLMSRFGGERAKKKQRVVDRLQKFLDKYCGIKNPESFCKEDVM